jgi:lysophospholipase L1-like esterase
MIYQNVELHNVAEVHEVPGREGVRLQRVPESVRVHLNEGAQGRMLSPACAEIRFVSEGESAEVTLSSGATTQAVLFHGPYKFRDHYSITNEKVTIKIPRRPRLDQLTRDFYKDMPFWPNVVRLMLAGEAVFFHGVEGDVRPPEPEEIPKLRYLAYGTSITHGGAASAPHLCYAAQTARRLGADLINLGVGGTAFCEKELADYIGSRDDWHIATLALSVNMMAGRFSLEEFYARVSYMVNRVTGSNTDRPVACITIFPHFRDFGEQFANEADLGTSEEFREALRRAARECPHPNVHLIEGADILTDLGGFTPDLIHPADNGMINMGENLARKLKALLG